MMVISWFNVFYILASVVYYCIEMINIRTSGAQTEEDFSAVGKLENGCTLVSHEQCTQCAPGSAERVNVTELVERWNNDASHSVVQPFGNQTHKTLHRKSSEFRAYDVVKQMCNDWKN